MAFKKSDYLFSPSSLSVFKDCPRCGWLAFKAKIKAPRGIFPSLPGGMDRVLKTYFDRFRAQGGLPPELVGKVAGELYPDQAQMKAWRNWRTGMKYQDPANRFVLTGALDDLLLEGIGDSMHTDSGDALTTPIDYKTRGAPPTGIPDSKRYYGLQLDVYALLLKANGFKPSNHAHLVYYFPAEIQARDNKDVSALFTCEVLTLDTSPERALEFVEDALAVLALPEPPASNPGCENCAYVRTGGTYK